MSFETLFLVVTVQWLLGQRWILDLKNEQRLITTELLVVDSVFGSFASGDHHADFCGSWNP